MGDETARGLKHWLEVGTGSLCLNHNEGSYSSYQECYCCWQPGNGYQLHGSVVFVPLGCPPYIHPKQHPNDQRLVACILNRTRTAVVNSPGMY